MTMNPNNLHQEVMGNPNELLLVDNFNPINNVHQLFNDQLYFSDHHHHHHHLPQLQFPLCNDQIPNTIHPLASMNYEPIAHFFPTGEDPGMGTTSNFVVNSSSQSGTRGLLANSKSDHGGKKRKRNYKEKEAAAGEKPREVVHVRAKRGEATDSHSLAERSRREKINEKLRCLQDLVPGCYKTMGMAVMLDVIINYVRSLQNQIDFLSMKLSAASLFYDFNSDLGTNMGTMQQQQQQGSNVYEPAGLENLIGGEGYVMQPQFHATWPY